MINVIVKRREGNDFVNFGTLFIPSYSFKCVTMELPYRSGSFKYDCCLADGSYDLSFGYAEGSPMFPFIKRRPKGYPMKPGFTTLNLHYQQLNTGFIAVGTGKDTYQSLRTTDEFKERFKQVFRDIFTNRDEIVTLVVRKALNYEYKPIEEEDWMRSDNNFIDESNDWNDEE